MEPITDFAAAVFNDGKYIINEFFPVNFIQKLQFDSYGKLIKLTDEVFKIYIVYFFVIKLIVEGLMLNVSTYIKSASEADYLFINRMLISLLCCGYSAWSDDVVKSNPRNQSHLSQNLRTKPAPPLVIDKSKQGNNKQKVLFQDNFMYSDMIEAAEFGEFFGSKSKQDLFRLFDSVAGAYLTVFKTSHEANMDRLKTLMQMQKQNVFNKQTKGRRR